MLHLVSIYAVDYLFSNSSIPLMFSILLISFFTFLASSRRAMFWLFNSSGNLHRSVVIRAPPSNLSVLICWRMSSRSASILDSDSEVLPRFFNYAMGTGDGSLLVRGTRSTIGDKSRNNFQFAHWEVIAVRSYLQAQARAMTVIINLAWEGGRQTFPRERNKLRHKT